MHTNERLRVAQLLSPLPSSTSHLLLRDLLVAEVCVRPAWCACLVATEAHAQMQALLGGSDGGAGEVVPGVRMASGPEELAEAACAGALE